jgi:hypothetical protein
MPDVAPVTRTTFPENRRVPAAATVGAVDAVSRPAAKPTAPVATAPVAAPRNRLRVDGRDCGASWSVSIMSPIAYPSKNTSDRS